MSNYEINKDFDEIYEEEIKLLKDAYDIKHFMFDVYEIKITLSEAMDVIERHKKRIKEEYYE